MNFKELIKGLHHVTATVNDVQQDYDFYVKLLGQRLIKETVNFDNDQVYHFYYGNETGTPSTIFTTFPYKNEGVRKGTVGSGQVFETAFSIPEGGLYFWKQRLEAHKFIVEESIRFEQRILTFNDPSGLKLAIMEDQTDRRGHVWVAPGLSRKTAILGIHSVMLAVTKVEETIEFLTFFGYESTRVDGRYTRMETSGKGAGNTVVVMDATGLPQGVNGLGTVHHVAHRVGSLEELLQVKAALEKKYQLVVTEVKDRKYFNSIYFRIPGGIIFEVATEGPGFLVDESKKDLGRSLKLPFWQEPKRAQIEDHLEPYKR